MEDLREMQDLFREQETEDLVEQCRLVAKLYEEKRAINQALEEKKGEFAVAQEKLLAIMERDGISSLVLGDQTVFKRETTYVSINKARIHEAFAWLKEHDYAGLIQENVNSRTLTTAYKEMAEHGIELPEDLFNVNPVATIGVNAKRR